MFGSSRGRPTPVALSKWGSGSGQSLRRGQKGGQNGSMGPKKNIKANSASGAVVHMVPAMGQNGSKWLKIGPKWPTVGSKWPTVGSKWVSIGLKWCHDGSARDSTGSTATQSAPLRTCRVQLEIEIDPDPGGPLSNTHFRANFFGPNKGTVK